MQAHSKGGLQGLEAQLTIKRKESKEILATRIQQLESHLKMAQEENSSLRERYQHLQGDFQFNLVVLDERDRELQRYDALTAKALATKRVRREELKQLQLQVAKLEGEKDRVTEEKQVGHSKSQHNAAQHRLQLYTLKCSMAAEIQKQTEEYGAMKLQLQGRIQELERELSRQKQEITAAFNHELAQQEHEVNLKMDEMRAVMLSQELKVRLQSDKAIQRQALLQDFCQKMQTQLQDKEQELKDLTAVKDCRIKELADELKLMENKWKKEEENYLKRYEDVMQALKECDAHLETRCQTYIDQLQKAEKHIFKLHVNMEVLVARAQCIQKGACEQKDHTIQKLCTEVESTRAGWDKYKSQVSREMATKDSEICMLQEKESKFVIELERSRKEIERYKNQLSAGLKRERALEQARVQVELEWQSRCEDMKAEFYLSNEQIIQDLTQARDQAKAELEKKKQELRELAVSLHSAKTKTDQAVQRVTPQEDPKASEGLRHLQEQNNILRAAINQMRKDMEGLNHLRPHFQAQPPASFSQPVPQEAQMATRLPAQPTGISCSINQADCLCQETHVKTSTKQDVRGSVTPEEDPRASEGLCHLREQNNILRAAVNQMRKDIEGLNHLRPPAQPTGISCSTSQAGMETNVNTSKEQTKHNVTGACITEQHQVENSCFQQQPASCQRVSDGLCECSQAAESRYHPLRSRLKKAAMHIARLCMEKQQLIEISNRLRSQITSPGVQKRNLNQESGNQQDRLTVLEKLQYQLTTQELQYVQRQGALSYQPQPGTRYQGPAPKETVNPRSQDTVLAEGLKKLSQSQSSLDEEPHPHCLSESLLPSVESLQSLKNVWEIMDRGLSSSPSEGGEVVLRRRETVESDGAGDQMTVHGISVPIHSHPPLEVQQKRNLSTAPSKSAKISQGAPSRMRRIRNYNVKE